MLDTCVRHRDVVAPLAKHHSDIVELLQALFRLDYGENCEDFNLPRGLLWNLLFTYTYVHYVYKPMVGLNEVHSVLLLNFCTDMPHYFAISQIVQRCFAGRTYSSVSCNVAFQFCLLQPLAYRAAMLL